MFRCVDDWAHAQSPRPSTTSSRPAHPIHADLRRTEADSSSLKHGCRLIHVSSTSNQDGVYRLAITPAPTITASPGNGSSRANGAHARTLNPLLSGSTPYVSADQGLSFSHGRTAGTHSKRTAARAGGGSDDRTYRSKASANDSRTAIGDQRLAATVALIVFASGSLGSCGRRNTRGYGGADDRSFL